MSRNAVLDVLTRAVRGRTVKVAMPVLLATLSVGGSRALGAVQLSLLEDSVLDSGALLFASNATYGRAINSVSYQTEALMTYGGYQYATWYHLGSDEDVYLARRSLSGGSWQVMDTGFNMTNTTSDAHNVISMGISGDGTVHLSWDHHNNTLKYANTDGGSATGSTWNSSIFNSQMSSLNVGGSTIYDVTYPRFITDPTSGDMYMTYRTGYSGNGDMNMVAYDSSSGLWGSSSQIINGSSADVNPYLNGMDVDSTGRLHTTWTWRPTAGSSNYYLMYAYSDNGGATWNNSDGVNLGSTVYPNSPGILIDDGNSGNGVLGELNIYNSIMNQQTQIVDGDGRVHMVMWHADDANRDSVSGFNTSASAYFHYYRDPSTGDWARTELPTDYAVGSRPDIAYDADGNIFVTYVTPGVGDSGGYYTDGDLVVASASLASGYTDWEVVYTDQRDFIGEPKFDQKRLLVDGVLSVYIQENDDAVTWRTGTPLHVIDFSVDSILQWVGDDSGNWTVGSGTDWDTNGDGVGNIAYSAGKTVWFGDGASTYNVNISNTVSPGATVFNHTSNTYTMTGAGIAGSGGLSVEGGGSVVLNNSANTYSGDTNVSNGTLSLQGNATIANSANINVTESGTLDVSGLASTFTLSNGQTLNNNSNSTVVGNVIAGDGSAVTGKGTFNGNLTAQSGSTIQIGGAGLTVIANVALIDDFDAYDNSSTTSLGATPNNLTGDTWIGVWDGTGGALITDDPDGDQSLAVREGSGWRGAETDLANNFAGDFSLADGQTATYFFQVMAEGNSTDCMIGLAESRASVDENNSWQDFSVMPYIAGGNLKVYGDNIGDQYVTPMTSGDWYNVWVVVDNDTKTFDMYWSTGTDGGTLAYSDVEFGRITNPTNLEAFAAMNAGTDLVHVDNLYMMLGESIANPLVSGESVSFAADVMTVDGDVILETGSTVIFDIATDGISDLLDISGELTAGGTLEVVLEATAPALELGDQFDLFDFASASGAFNDFILPELSAGLYWDTTALLSTGMLTVVDSIVMLDGDLNGDGFVGLDDLDIVLSAWNQNVTAGDWAAGDPSGDGYVGLDDLDIILGNWNAGTPAGENAAIPEPTSALLVAGCVLAGVSRRNRA